MIMTIFRLLLLVGLIVCAAATALVKKPMQAVIIYMAYSVIMSVVWIMLFLTLRRLNLIDQDEAHRRQEEIRQHTAAPAEQGEEADHVQ